MHFSDLKLRKIWDSFRWERGKGGVLFSAGMVSILFIFVQITSLRTANDPAHRVELHSSFVLTDHRFFPLQWVQLAKKRSDAGQRAISFPKVAMRQVGDLEVNDWPNVVVVKYLYGQVSLKPRWRLFKCRCSQVACSQSAVGRGTHIRRPKLFPNWKVITYYLAYTFLLLIRMYLELIKVIKRQPVLKHLNLSLLPAKVIHRTWFHAFYLLCRSWRLIFRCRIGWPFWRWPHKFTAAHGRKFKLM